MLFRNDEDVHRRLRVEVREGEHVVVLIQARDRDFTGGDLAEEAVWSCSHVRMLNLRGYFLKYFGSNPGSHGL